MYIQDEIIESIDRLEFFINQLINCTNITNSVWALRRSETLLQNIRQNVWKEKTFQILLPKIPEDLIYNILSYIA
tara:strand:- start:171 stop:395 length:225 start_codon:yes stop_codon:yes gene_type:complete